VMLDKVIRTGPVDFADAIRTWDVSKFLTLVAITACVASGAITTSCSLGTSGAIWTPGTSRYCRLRVVAIPRAWAAGTFSVWRLGEIPSSAKVLTAVKLTNTTNSEQFIIKRRICEHPLLHGNSIVTWVGSLRTLPTQWGTSGLQDQLLQRK